MRLRSPIHLYVLRRFHLIQAVALPIPFNVSPAPGTDLLHSAEGRKRALSAPEMLPFGETSRRAARQTSLPARQPFFATGRLSLHPRKCGVGGSMLGRPMQAVRTPPEMRGTAVFCGVLNTGCPYTPGNAASTGMRQALDRLVGLLQRCSYPTRKRTCRALAGHGGHPTLPPRRKGPLAETPWRGSGRGSGRERFQQGRSQRANLREPCVHPRPTVGQPAAFSRGTCQSCSGAESYSDPRHGWAAGVG